MGVFLGQFNHRIPRMCPFVPFLLTSNLFMASRVTHSIWYIFNRNRCDCLPSMEFSVACDWLPQLSPARRSNCVPPLHVERKVSCSPSDRDLKFHHPAFIKDPINLVWQWVSHGVQAGNVSLSTLNPHFLPTFTLAVER
jgi:hypothetical protein